MQLVKVAPVPAPIAENWQWQEHGACRNLRTARFFHAEGQRGSQRAQLEHAAKAVCATCPVLRACRKHALGVPEPYGVWGGLSETERQQILNHSPGDPAASNHLHPATPQPAPPPKPDR